MGWAAVAVPLTIGLRGEWLEAQAMRSSRETFYVKLGRGMGRELRELRRCKRKKHVHVKGIKRKRQTTLPPFVDSPQGAKDIQAEGATTGVTRISPTESRLRASTEHIFIDQLSTGKKGMFETNVSMSVCAQGGRGREGSTR
eukprot:TRINITY_DN2079_c0_g3_i1.p1 TRINITY_DN2079_c0_g3~~TRINITY_DN2079_c0_g3_i1.p1  ORF type:complete len:142 (-),score=3.10 TRINITY_DN2079_c0_g3_i1:193-618(-)